MGRSFAAEKSPAFSLPEAEGVPHSRPMCLQIKGSKYNLENEQINTSSVPVLFSYAGLPRPRTGSPDSSGKK